MDVLIQRRKFLYAAMHRNGKSRMLTVKFGGPLNGICFRKHMLFCEWLLPELLPKAEVFWVQSTGQEGCNLDRAEVGMYDCI